MTGESPPRAGAGAGSAFAIGALVAVALFSLAAIGGHFALDEPQVRAGLESWSNLAEVASGLTPVAFATAGSLILLYRSANRVAVLFTVAGLAWSIANVARIYGRFAAIEGGYVVIGSRVVYPPFGSTALWISRWGIWLGIAAVTGVLFLLFPDGRLPSKRWRPLAAVTVAAGVAMVLRFAIGPMPSRLQAFALEPAEFLGTRINVFGREEELVRLLFILSIGVSAVALSTRYRRADDESRYQLKWFLFAAGLVAAVYAAVPALEFTGSLTASVSRALTPALLAAPILLAVATAFAVMRYHLYDIDAVLSKTILFGAMSLFVSVAYVGLTTGVGTMIAARGPTNTLMTALALSPVAVSFAPLRARTQRLADRLVYGKRAEPYEVLASFARTLPTTLHLDAVLPSMTAAVGTGLSAASVSVHLYLRDGARHVAHWTSDDIGATRTAVTGGSDLVVPIAFRDEQVGRLEVTKHRGEGITPEDRRLARLIAHYGAAALHNVRLTLELKDKGAALANHAHELQASRRRLVTAHHQARHSLEQEVRRDVVPNLSVIPELVEKARRAGPPEAAALLEQASRAAAVALDSLRDIAHGVFSPLVDELGVVAALESHLRDERSSSRVRVDPGFVEGDIEGDARVAMYWCCVDIARHVGSPVTFAFDRDDRYLVGRVRGDGFDPHAHLGRPRLQHLADRVEAVRGRFDVTYASGVDGAVVVRVPLRKESA